MGVAWWRVLAMSPRTSLTYSVTLDAVNRTEHEQTGAPCAPRRPRDTTQTTHTTPAPGCVTHTVTRAYDYNNTHITTHTNHKYIATPHAAAGVAKGAWLPCRSALSLSPLSLSAPPVYLRRLLRSRSRRARTLAPPSVQAVAHARRTRACLLRVVQPAGRLVRAAASPYVAHTDAHICTHAAWTMDHNPISRPPPVRSPWAATRATSAATRPAARPRPTASLPRCDAAAWSDRRPPPPPPPPPAAVARPREAATRSHRR